jgi:hypothetical protein
LTEGVGARDGDSGASGGQHGGRDGSLTSATLSPASIRLIAWMICSSLNRRFRIAASPVF